MENGGILAITVALKFLGAVAGAIIALIFLPPKTTNEFFRRAVLSLLAGLLFGDAVHDYLKWASTWQMELASTALTAMLSWFVIGAAVRIIGSWKGK